MSVVILRILSAGAVYALINLGYANNLNDAFRLKNEKIGQVANPEIVAACTSLMPVFDSKGSGTFTFTCDTDDDIVSIPNQGAAFSSQVRTAINQYVQPGRMVTVDDIRVKGPDGRTNKAPSLVYYIK